MIVTLAVYSGDRDIALKLLEWINELGGVAHRTLVLATTQQVDPLPLMVVAQKGWGTVEHLTIQTNQEVMPWPMGNNVNFLAVAKYMEDRGRPFFFLESDVLPLRSTWLDELESEYQRYGKPFMGDVHGMLDNAGKLIPGSEHMNGSGVYPPRALTYLPSHFFLNTIMSVSPDGKTQYAEPWDVLFRHEMLSLVDGGGGFKQAPGGGRISICHATDLICFCWKSYNYREENGRLVCETRPQAMHRQLDVSRHALHHGCKDDSLLDILRARLRRDRAGGAAPAPEMEFVPMPPPNRTYPPILPSPIPVEPEPVAEMVEEADPHAERFVTVRGLKAWQAWRESALPAGSSPEQLAEQAEAMLEGEQRSLHQTAQPPLATPPAAAAVPSKQTPGAYVMRPPVIVNPPPAAEQQQEPERPPAADPKPSPPKKANPAKGRAKGKKKPPATGIAYLKRPAAKS